MRVGEDKAQVFIGRKNEPGPTLTADEKRDGGQAHFENFIEPYARARLRTSGPLSRKDTSQQRSATWAIFRIGLGDRSNSTARPNGSSAMKKQTSFLPVRIGRPTRYPTRRSPPLHRERQCQTCIQAGSYR